MNFKSWGHMCQLRLWSQASGTRDRTFGTYLKILIICTNTTSLCLNTDQILTLSSSRGLPVCGDGAVVCVEPEGQHAALRAQVPAPAALPLNHPALGELPATLLCAWLFLSVKGKSKIWLVLSHFIQDRADQRFDAYEMNEWETWINMGMPWECWGRSKS